MRVSTVLSFRALRFLLIGLFAWTLIAWAAARTLIVHAAMDNADAIVVLSGSSAYEERTGQAAELFHHGRAPLIVLTDDHTRGGWSSAEQRNPFFVERASTRLVELGVPRERIKIAAGLAASTYDEAQLLKHYARDQGFRSVLIVTSAYHSRRALWTFRKALAGTSTSVGLEHVPLGNHTPSTVFWWLQPEGWRSVGGEYVKLVYYWMKYE
jgi:uncharacterized SAM-binding protein YcdF (DUF218 family)